MSYADIENSATKGSPIELYRFALGKKRRWTYTSGQTAVTHQYETYIPAPIKRSSIEQGNEINRSSIEITLPRDNPLATMFIASPPEGVVSVTLYRYHASDAGTEVIVLWKGRVGGARLSGSVLILKCEPIATSLKRPGLRARYHLICRHALYSARCGVPSATYRIDGEVLAVNGVNVQVAAAASKPDGYFVAGMLATADAVRMIVGHSGVDLTLVAPMPGLTAGMSVQLYAGCDHAVATCRDRFNNLDNYGGFPYIPIKNPFTGDAIV